MDMSTDREKSALDKSADQVFNGNDTNDQDNTNVLIQIPDTKICYYPLKNIGQGATSTVYLGISGNTKCKTSAAVKLVKQEYTKIIQNELEIWKLLLSDMTGSSCNIVKLFDWGQYETNYSTTETMFVLAMEPASCNLRQFVMANPQPSTELLKSVCFDMGKGLKFLHGKRTLHRDIKPENVLIFQNDQSFVAKLGDFGLSSIINHGTTNTTARGTELWMSPEALTKLHQGQKFKHTKSVDIFSLGMTMYFALSTGQHPFSYSDQHGNFPEMNIKDPNVLPKKLLDIPNYTEMDLLDWMLQKDPKKRPNIQKVLLHPMFWSKEKCLDFICYIARKNNDKSDAKCQELRKEIENEYHVFHQSLFTKELKWKSVIDERLFERKGRGKKRYQESIFSLVEMIRDKREHHCDMVEELLYERFSDDGVFSDEKYMEYFLNLFPHIIQFFFTYFIKRNAMFNHNAIKSSSFETENKVFASGIDQVEDGDFEISKLDFGKLQFESEKERKSVAIQTIHPTDEITPKVIKHAPVQIEKGDYIHWNEEDYDRWHDYRPLDEYDPADDYNPLDDIHLSNEYDPADDYNPLDDIHLSNEYDPADDYNPSDDCNPLNEYDPADDYNPLDDCDSFDNY